MNISEVWPEWQEECVLGEGSFGKVYKAKRAEYGRTFYSAIKVITVPKGPNEIKYARSQGMSDNEVYEYFRSIVDGLLNEISLMDNLKGAKNIVGIEDYKIVEHQEGIGWDIFIRMELLTPFDSFVSNPEFSQKDVIKLGVDICSALEVCEQNNIVHRDIKPDNVFISRFGEYKLGDFGIARKMEATQANLSRKGTLNYMAPEVYKSEEYGSNVDIYSLGMVLYTLLNNNRVAFLDPYNPITYKDNESALSKRLSGVTPPLPCNASQSLGRVILKACAYNPHERYQNATEFKNDLIDEWNVLVQSGENREIKSISNSFSNGMDPRHQNTTNDMTSNGRVVIDGGTTVLSDGTTVLSEGTTVLNNETTVLESQSQYLNYNQENFWQGTNDTNGKKTNTPNSNIPPVNINAKSNKVCKILAYPLAIIMCVVWFVINPYYYSSPYTFVPAVALGVTILFAGNNKRVIGSCLALIALPLVYNCIEAFFIAIQFSFSIDVTLSLLTYLLMLFAGIVIFFQKEVRFGGTLCIYSLVLMAIQMIFKFRFSLNSMVCFGALLLAVFFWSYGYKSDKEIKGAAKIIHIASYGLIIVSIIATVLGFIVGR